MVGYIVRHNLNFYAFFISEKNAKGINIINMSARFTKTLSADYLGPIIPRGLSCDLRAGRQEILKFQVLFGRYLG